MTKRTLRGTKLKRLRKSGFRARTKTASGKRVLKLRRKKNRSKIAIN